MPRTVQIIVRGREFLELSTAGDRLFSRKRMTIGTPCGLFPEYEWQLVGAPLVGALRWLSLNPDLDAIALEVLPPFPARDAETRYTIRLNLNAPNTHRCPPTMPGPPTMSTCTRYNRQSQPAARNAPDAAATIESCADLPSAAPPTGSGMISNHAAHARTADTRPGFLSREERRKPNCPPRYPPPLHIQAIVRTIAGQNCPENVPKLSTSESRHELSTQYPVTRRNKISAQTVPNRAKLRI